MSRLSPQCFVPYAHLGRMEEAKTIATELLRLKPDYSAKWVSAQEPYKSPADLDHRLMASAKRAYQSDGRLLPDLALQRHRGTAQFGPLLTRKPTPVRTRAPFMAEKCQKETLDLWLYRQGLPPDCASRYDRPN